MVGLCAGKDEQQRDNGFHPPTCRTRAISKRRMTSPSAGGGAGVDEKRQEWEEERRRRRWWGRSAPAPPWEARWDREGEELARLRVWCLFIILSAVACVVLGMDHSSVVEKKKSREEDKVEKKKKVGRG